MADDLDTPPGLEPSTDGIPQWLVVHITQIKGLVKTNYKAIGEVKEDVGTIKEGQTKLATQLARTDQKVESHMQHHRDNPVPHERPTPHNPSGNPTGVTYQWVADWGMKAAFLLGGGIVTIIGKLIYDALTK